MSTTEFPKLGDPRIAAGTFVIFSFDPAAYASVIDPDDALLSAAASQIKRKKYLGLVEGAGPLDVPKLRQNLDIRVVGLAPPQEGEDDEYPTGPHRCIPIAPGTSHPEGREPLKTSVPLPWPAAYVHTLQLTNGFVSRIYHSNPTNATVSKDEMRRTATCSVLDRCAAADERRALKPAVPEETNSDDKEGDYFYGSDDESYESGSDSSFDGAELTIPSKAYMEVWEDLTVATSLGEPKDIGADFDEIMELGIQWQQRKKQELRVNDAKMSSWAARVAECSESDVEEMPEGGYFDNDCDDLTPEDAVDERMATETHCLAAQMTPILPSVQTDLVGHPTVDTADMEDDHMSQTWLEFLWDWLRGALRM